MRRKVLLLTACFSISAIALANQPSQAEYNGPLTTVSVLQMVFVLVVIIGLIVAIGFAARRFNALGIGGGISKMQVLHSLALGGRERLLLVQAGDEYLLLGVAPGSVNFVKTVDYQAWIANSTNESQQRRGGGSFSSHMKRMMASSISESTEKKDK